MWKGICSDGVSVGNWELKDSIGLKICTGELVCFIFGSSVLGLLTVLALLMYKFIKKTSDVVSRCQCPILISSRSSLLTSLLCSAVFYSCLDIWHLFSVSIDQQICGSYGFCAEFCKIAISHFDRGISGSVTVVVVGDGEFCDWMNNLIKTSEISLISSLFGDDMPFSAGDWIHSAEECLYISRAELITIPCLLNLTSILLGFAQGQIFKWLWLCLIKPLLSKYWSAGTVLNITFGKIF